MGLAIWGPKECSCDGENGFPGCEFGVASWPESLRGVEEVAMGLQKFSGLSKLV